MILPPHSHYVDSGVEWLGEIPSHWELYRSKTLFQKMARPVNETDAIVTCFRDGIVTLRKNRREAGFTTALKEIGYQGVRKGDLVIHQMDAFAGAIGVSDSDGKCTPVYSVCEAQNGANQYYYAYIVREMARTQWIFALATGIRERSTDFRYTTFSNQDLPFPPPDEQTVIVNFLDVADKQIQYYIRAKQKLIAVLNEQKQAIIQHAVTRGLNPDAPMKDSGIEWLGQIPSHWELKPAKYLFRAITRRDILGSEVKLSVTQKYGLVPTDEMSQKAMQAMSYDNFQVCYPDDLILNKYKAHLGVFWASHQRGLITPNYTVFVPVAPLETLYYELLFHTRMYKEFFTISVYGVTEGMSPLYTQDFYQTPCLYPSFQEQKLIVNKLNQQSSEIDKIINQIIYQIDCIREYRTRLIADVVTGKLDVRGADFDMPAEFDETDLPDVAEDELFNEDDDLLDDLGEINHDENGYE